MSVTDTPPQTPKSSRRRSVALVISLAVNVLLIAVIAVTLMRAVNGGFIRQPGGVLAPASVMRELPEDRRQAIRAVQVKHQDAMRSARREARRARLAVFRVFAAPDFDPAAFDRALAHVHDADAALEMEAIAMVKDVVTTLTPQERSAVAAKVRQRARWWRPFLQQNN
jgi:uncharacterized membrane protein